MKKVLLFLSLILAMVCETSFAKNVSGQDVNLASVLNGCQDGDELCFEPNVVIKSCTITKSVTLKLENGTRFDGQLVISNGAKVTLRAAGNIFIDKVSDSDYSIEVANGNFTYEGSGWNLDAVNNCRGAVLVKKGSFTANGGRISGNEGVVARRRDGSTDDVKIRILNGTEIWKTQVALYMDVNGLLVVDNPGTYQGIQSEKQGIVVLAGIAELSNINYAIRNSGPVGAVEDRAKPTLNNKVPYIDGEPVVALKIGSNSGAGTTVLRMKNVNISKNEVHIDDNYYSPGYDVDYNKVLITGGENHPTQYALSDCDVQIVVQGSVEQIPYVDVCSIGSRGFASLERGVDEVSDGGTITLLTDITPERIAPLVIDKNITLDGDSHTISGIVGNGETDAFFLLKSGSATTLTLKNINVNTSSYMADVPEDCRLVLESGTFANNVKGAGEGSITTNVSVFNPYSYSGYDVPADYIWMEQPSGWWILKPVSQTTYTDKDGNTCEGTFEDAVANSTEGATIILNKDVALSSKMLLKAGMTIDAKNHNFTINDDFYGDCFFYYDGTVTGDPITVKNLNLNFEDGYPWQIFYVNNEVNTSDNIAPLILDHCKITTSYPTIISNYGGNVTTKSCKFENKDSKAHIYENIGKAVIEDCEYYGNLCNREDGDLTIKSGKINGNVFDNEGKLTIESGEFYSEYYYDNYGDATIKSGKFNGSAFGNYGKLAIESSEFYIGFSNYQSGDATINSCKFENYDGTALFNMGKMTIKDAEFYGVTNVIKDIEYVENAYFEPTKDTKNSVRILPMSAMQAKGAKAAPSDAGITIYRKNDGSYLCYDLTLVDNNDFCCPVDFTVVDGKATYQREVNPDNALGALALPYEVASNDDMELYTLGLQEYDNDDIVLVMNKLETVPAGQPCLYYNKAKASALVFDGVKTGDYINVTKDHPYKEIYSEGNESLGLCGTYQGFTTENVDYPWSSNVYIISGGKFKTSSKSMTIKPFRSFLELDVYNYGGYAKNITLNWDESVTTAINDVFGEDSQVEDFYDIQGRRQEGLQKGMNIVKLRNGKTQKILVK